MRSALQVVVHVAVVFGDSKMSPCTIFMWFLQSDWINAIHRQYTSSLQVALENWQCITVYLWLWTARMLTKISRSTVLLCGKQRPVKHVRLAGYLPEQCTTLAQSLILRYMEYTICFSTTEATGYASQRNTVPVPSQDNLGGLRQEGHLE